MATNEYLPFANVGGANVLTQVDYEALAARTVGFSAGIARSVELNKVWRQSSVMTSALAEFIADSTGLNVLDDGDRDALAALFLQALQTRTRIQLSADLNLYVNDASGNDLNNGLTAGTAFKTIQRAWNEMFLRYDFNNHNAIINVADGTYANAAVLQGTPVGLGASNTITIRGNLVTPSTCIISPTPASCFTVQQVAVSVRIEGFRLTATGTPGIYINHGHAIVVSNATVSVNKLEFGSCAGSHLCAFGGGTISSDANPYAIVGGAQHHALAVRAGCIVLVQSTVTLTGTPAFSGAFAAASECGTLELYGTTWTGSATGLRYSANANGVINVGGAGATYLPGATAGATATGGQYV